MLAFFIIKEEIMGVEEKSFQLYKDINYIGYLYVCKGKNDYVKRANNLLPQIQEFVQWFLAGNQFGIEDEVYQALQQNLLVILEDIATALKENDSVLMLDALEQGISEYLLMFIPEKFWKQEREKAHDRSVE